MGQFEGSILPPYIVYCEIAFEIHRPQLLHIHLQLKVLLLVVALLLMQLRDAQQRMRCSPLEVHSLIGHVVLVLSSLQGSGC